MNNEAKYIIRLDDACPTFTLAKWQRFFDLFDEFNIKPIIAVIPANKDPKLMVENRAEEDFWAMARNWQSKGYRLALHGYDHVYINNDAGILGYTPHSEFCNLTLEQQSQKIRKGCEIFIAKGLNYPKLFIAPSHSIDLNTLSALKGNKITTISDGFYTHPYSKYGLSWIPCQLSFPKIKKRGVWTLCYHPETCPDDAFESLRTFVNKHSDKFQYIENDLKPSSLKFADHFELFKSKLKRSKTFNMFLKIYATLRAK